MTLVELVKELGVSMKVTKAGAVHLIDGELNRVYWVWNPMTALLRKRWAGYSDCGAISAKNVDTEEKAVAIFKNRILKNRV